MEARSGQNHDDKIAPQVKFNLTALKYYGPVTYFCHQ